MEFTLKYENCTVRFDPETCALSVCLPESTHRFDNDCALMLRGGRALRLSDADCQAKRVDTGVLTGVRAVYTNFREANGMVHPRIVMHTLTAIDTDTGDLRMEFYVEGDDKGQIEEAAYPAPVAYLPKPGTGITVLPNQQGLLVRDGNDLPFTDGIIFSRDAYMPFYGQLQDNTGYMAIFDTPYDVRYFRSGKNSQWIQPLWRPSMGYMRYPRVMLYRFFDRNAHPDYVTLAKSYRQYLMSRGRFVSLNEKFARNPHAADMPGRPIVHYAIAHNIDPTCSSYQEKLPHVHDVVSFAEREKMLEALYKKGLRNAYTHVDGWGVNGYDNQHPDYFPVNAEAGGADGMRKLSETTNRLGYYFGIHDQYRDYYYNARSFSFDNAILQADDTPPYCDVWDGGVHTWLCASLAPAYVRRNYREFDRLHIHLDGSYLDVFSVVEPDECLNPAHPMTRQECVAYRRQCLEYLNQRGIVTSSEEVADCVIPSLILCHHAPNYMIQPEDYDKYIPIPLFSLVYHDALLVPWYGLAQRKTEFSFPTDWGFLFAMLNGGTVYVDVDATEEEIDRCNEAVALHRRIATLEMTRHEFLSENCRIQRSTFADGTTVTIDLDRKTWQVTDPT